MIRLSRLLIGRGALNALFGLYFLLAASSSVLRPLQQAGYYFCVDGVLALCTAYVLLRGRSAPWLISVATASALARVLLGAWFLLVPELAGQALTGVLVLVVLSVAAVGLGVGEAVLAFAFGRRSAEFWTVFIAAGLAVAAGIALFYVFPDAAGIRRVFGVYALAFGLVLLSAGLRGAPRAAA